MLLFLSSSSPVGYFQAGGSRENRDLSSAPHNNVCKKKGARIEIAPSYFWCRGAAGECGGPRGAAVGWVGSVQPHGAERGGGMGMANAEV